MVAGVDYYSDFLGTKQPFPAVGLNSVVVGQSGVRTEQAEGRDDDAIPGRVQQGRLGPLVDQVADGALAAAPGTWAARIGTQLMAFDEEGEPLFG